MIMRIRMTSFVTILDNFADASTNKAHFGTRTLMFSYGADKRGFIAASAASRDGGVLFHLHRQRIMMGADQAAKIK